MADILTGLIGHWKLDESSGSIASDAASGNDGSLITFPASPWEPVGQVDGALAFDGVDDYVNAAAATTYSTASLTFAAWVNVDGLKTSDQWVVGSGDDVGLYIDYETNTARFYWYDGSTWPDINNPSSDNISGTGWAHVAGTFDSATKEAKVYVDGVLVDSITAPTQISYTTGVGDGLQIGSMDGGRNFEGKLDDVRVYNRALALADIQELASMATASGSIDVTNLVAEWVFDEATSGTDPTFVNDGIGDSDPNIFYETGGGWVVDNGAGIYYPNTTHVTGLSIVELPTNGASLASALGSSCQKFTAVLVTNDIVGTAAYARIIQLGSWNTNGDFAITVDASSTISAVLYAEDTPVFEEGLLFSYGNVSLLGGPHVIAVVIDTTEAVLEDRVKLYKNGVFQAQGTSFSGANTLNIGADFNRLPCFLTFMNRASADTPCQGALHYASIFNEAVSASQIAEISTHLLVNNDSSLLIVDAGYRFVSNTIVAVQNSAIMYAPDAIFVSTFIAEWVLNEAATGTDPITVQDDIGDCHMDVVYAGEGFWTSIPAGRGLYLPTTTHTGGLWRADISTNSFLGGVLGSTRQKLSAVVVVKDLEGVVAASNILAIMNDLYWGQFNINITDDGRPEIRYGMLADEAIGWRWSFDIDLRSGVFVVIAIIDTTDSVPEDRIKLYVNGSRVDTYALHNTGTQNLAVDFDLTTIDVSFMNRGGGARPVKGSVYYGALLNEVMPEAQIWEVSNTLLQDNDSGLLQGFKLLVVDGDNSIFHGQPNVVLTTQEAGVAEGLVEFGGIVQNITSWAGESVTIHPVDADGLLVGEQVMTVSKPKTTEALAPYGLVASNETKTTIDLDWSFDGASHTGFEIEQWLSAQWTLVITLGTAARFWQATGLPSGTYIGHRIRAI